MGSSEDDHAFAVTTATDGSVYVAGGTSGNLDGQTNSGGLDAFITKFNPDVTKVKPYFRDSIAKYAG